MRPRVIVQNEDTGCKHGRPVLANLWTQNILQKLSVVCRCYSGPRRHFVCCYHSILIISHNHHELNFRLLAATFFLARRSCILPLFASCANSSHDWRRSSSDRVLTITTDVSSVAVTGRPLLGSSWMLNRHSRKRDVHRDTVLDLLHYPPKPHVKHYEFRLGLFLAKFQISCIIAGHCARSDSSQFLLPFQGSVLQNRDHVACENARSILY